MPRLLASATGSPSAALSSTGSPSPSPGPTHPVISGGQVWGVLGITAAMVLLIGVVLVWARRSGAAKPERVAKASVVRSWIALSLVTGLLIFCAAAFAIDDSPLRSTLMGALAAAVGSATAFYFSSKSTDQAQQAQKDLVSAAIGTETVPKLVGSTLEKAAQALGTTSLKLVTDPSSTPPSDDKVVATQAPVAGAVVNKNTQVVVTYGPPEPAPRPRGCLWFFRRS